MKATWLSEQKSVKSGTVSPLELTVYAAWQVAVPCLTSVMTDCIRGTNMSAALHMCNGEQNILSVSVFL